MCCLPLPTTCSESGTLTTHSHSGASEAGGDHTSWNPRALRNWIICFGILLDSDIITFFPVLLNHSISKQTWYSISQCWKSPPWTPHHLQFMPDSSDSTHRKIWADWTHCLSRLHFFIVIRLLFPLCLLKNTLFIVLPNAMFSWPAVLIHATVDHSPPHLLVSLFRFTWDLLGHSFLVSPESSSPSWCLYSQPIVSCISPSPLSALHIHASNIETLS